MKSTAPAIRSLAFSVLRPLLWWIVVSSLLFLWRFHEVQSAKATIQFMVSREGQPGQVFHEASINGMRYRAGERCGVGRKKLVVTARNAEPFETNVFVWYGGAAFGNITLPRTRGKMDLDISPRAESVRITGSEERLSLTNFTREPLPLPTGRYLVETKFARFTVERTVEITRHQTTLVSIVPSITALHLSSVPEKAEFEMTSTKGPQIYVSGGTPTTIPDLPVGELVGT